jgi:hypothetical protein
LSSRLSVARGRAVGSNVDVAMVDPFAGELEWRSCHRTSPHGESAFIVCKQSSRGPRIGRVVLLPSSREHTMWTGVEHSVSQSSLTRTSKASDRQSERRL